MAMWAASPADIGQGLILTAAAAGAAGTLLRSRPARWLWRRNVSGPLFKRFRSEVENVVDERLEPIVTELHPNGGTSLRDQVDRCVDGLDDLRGQVEAQQERR